MPTTTPTSTEPLWAKVIDHTRCIGCHACTTACKSENEVPLSVTRTYVKYVDKGHFPNARRSFQVTRCNQCEDAPCVAACPTAAMYRRPDGMKFQQLVYLNFQLLVKSYFSIFVYYFYFFLFSLWVVALLKCLEYLLLIVRFAF